VDFCCNRFIYDLNLTFNQHGTFPFFIRYFKIYHSWRWRCMDSVLPYKTVPERLVLFIERLNPANMLIRLNATAYTANDLHSLIIEEIRNEYQHNITQQIYVSSRAWAAVKHIKDDTLNIVNNAAKSLPETASGLDLSKTMLAYLTQLEDNPYEIGANMLRKDLEELF
jgi:hypothetical protein